MSVLVDFVKFLLSFRNNDTTSFKNTKITLLIHWHFKSTASLVLVRVPLEIILKLVYL